MPILLKMYCFQLSLGNPFIILRVLGLPTFLIPPPCKEHGSLLCRVSRRKETHVTQSWEGDFNPLSPTPRIWAPELLCVWGFSSVKWSNNSAFLFRLLWQWGDRIHFMHLININYDDGGCFILIKISHNLKLFRREKNLGSKLSFGASLVAQWLRICLPIQGTRVQALVWEDPTCRGATRLVSHNYWACMSGACAPQQERPR